ncbi:MAG TPA: cyclic nucleotide-binding domain-containing protein [Actinomycetota bacterium]|nr:cyclic nucleotide-binding domain-containing protein [Actinomycetota bacterium]
MDAERLKQLPLFADLPHKQLVRVAGWADEIDLPEGKHLIQQGAFPHEFFLITEGTAQVLHDGRHIADLGSGDFFGEIALVEHQRRTASVVASTPIRVVVMAAREFDAMDRELPEVAERIRQEMLGRRREFPEATGAGEPEHDQPANA